jgi:hypothetical protein
MGKGKGRVPKKEKDKFDGLSQEFRGAIDGSSTEEIRKRVSEVALLDATEKQVLKNDPDVVSAREVLKNLMEPYRENFKSYKLQIEYCRQALDGSGKDTTTTATAKAIEGILNPDGTGRTTVSHKPIGSKESTVLRQGTDT